MSTEKKCKVPKWLVAAVCGVAAAAAIAAIWLLANPPASPLKTPPTDAQMTQLRETYPEYFGLDTSKGLRVYVWQMAENSYDCALQAGKDPYYDGLATLTLKGATMEEMQQIVASYFPRISREDVKVIPTVAYHSSYANPLDYEQQTEAFTALFWSGFLEE